MSLSQPDIQQQQRAVIERDRFASFILPPGDKSMFFKMRQEEIAQEQSSRGELKTEIKASPSKQSAPEETLSKPTSFAPAQGVDKNPLLGQYVEIGQQVMQGAKTEAEKQKLFSKVMEMAGDKLAPEDLGKLAKILLQPNNVGHA